MWISSCFSTICWKDYLCSIVLPLLLCQRSVDYIYMALLLSFPLICLLFANNWRRQWHPTPVLLPGESHGQRSLVGCSPWGRWSRTRLSDFTFTFIHWRRKWQTTPVFLPGESQGWGSLVGCRLWGCTESDTTEVN